MVKARGLQRTDALAVVAAVARLNRLELVYETLRCALNAIARTEPQWLQRIVPQSFIERYGERAEAERLVTEKGAKAQVQTRQLAEQAGQDGLWLLARLDDPDSPHALQALAEVATLRTVWEQQFVVRPAAPLVSQDSTPRITPGSSQWSRDHSNATRPRSALQRKKGCGLGGLQSACDRNGGTRFASRDHGCPTSTAAAAGEAQVRAIQESLEQQAVPPAQHIVDTAYVSGKTIATSADRDIELIGRVHPDASPQAHLVGGITSSQFEVDWERKVAHCPAGHTSVTWSETTDHGQPVTHVGFAARTCVACAYYDRCVLGKKEKPRGRRLKLRAYHALIRAQREKQTQESFQQLYRKRAGIGATLSVMVRAQGLRRTRYVGLLKTHLRNLFIAAARNLRRCARWLVGERPKARGRRTVGLTMKAIPHIPSAVV